MNPPIPGMTKRPYGEEFMADAFFSFVGWALSSQAMLAEYQKYFMEDGNDLDVNDWLVVHHWGEEE